MHKLELTQIGDALALVLPEEVVDRLRLRADDTVYLIETEAGLELTASNPEITEQLDLGRRLMDQYPETFKKLAE